MTAQEKNEFAYRQMVYNSDEFDRWSATYIEDYPEAKRLSINELIEIFDGKKNDKRT